VQPRRLDLEHFFRPRTVAVIGASDSTRRPNTAMWRKLRAWGEARGADVIPVNPTKETVDGVPCVDSVFDVPGEIDLAVILVGDAVGTFAQVLERKARYAVIFSAGFSEVGEEGERLERELEDLIAGGDVRLLGPNTNLNAFEVFRDDLPGPAIALITQSGHQGRPIFQSQQLGIRLSHWAPVGNEADLEFADFATWFADQPEVGVVAAYVEGFKDGRTLALAADHCMQAGVPIVAVKVGRTDEGASMAKSHTGHLTGADAVVDGVFRQHGVVRVDGLDELQDTAAMFARTKAPKGDGVCIYAISGGTGAHMADLCAAAGLRLPELEPETQRRLHEWIPEYLRVSNPVDNGGPPSADERGRKILDAIVADPNVDLIICPITGALPTMGRPLAEDLVAVAATTDKPICVIWGSPLSDDPAYAEVLLGSQLPVFRTFHNCVQAVTAYFDWHEVHERHRSPFAKPVLRRSAAAPEVDELLRGRSALSEHEAKAVLAAYGIPVSEDRLCTSAAEAARAASSLGFPVVMKLDSADIAHKSDLGLVRVGVSSPAEAKRTYAELLAIAANKAPKAEVAGVLVCEMVTGGVEAVVGMSQDPLFGPTVMVGLGGVLVEVFEDVAIRVPPFDKAEAKRMVTSLKGLPLLQGARGAKKADVSALVDVVMKVQRLAVDHHDTIQELDINPLAVLPRGAKALDALVVPRSS
jgi:acyl-CoA synthetase (NDP forming)